MNSVLRAAIPPFSQGFNREGHWGSLPFLVAVACSRRRAISGDWRPPLQPGPPRIFVNWSRKMLGHDRLRCATGQRNILILLWPPIFVERIAEMWIDRIGINIFNGSIVVQHIERESMTY